MTIKFLKEDSENFEVGDSIRIESTIKSNEPFSDTRTLTDPNTVEITIIDDYNNTTVVNGVSMSKNATGEYFYNWDTSSLSAGDYKIEVKAEGSGSTEIEDDFIRLEN